MYENGVHVFITSANEVMFVCWFVSRIKQERLNGSTQNLDGWRVSAQNRWFLNIFVQIQTQNFYTYNINEVIVQTFFKRE